MITHIPRSEPNWFFDSRKTKVVEGEIFEHKKRNEAPTNLFGIVKKVPKKFESAYMITHIPRSEPNWFFDSHKTKVVEGEIFEHKKRNEAPTNLFGIVKKVPKKSESAYMITHIPRSEPNWFFDSHKTKVVEGEIFDHSKLRHAAK